MLVPIKWINDYVEIDASAEEYGDVMTMAGITLETVRHFGDEMEKVVVGRIEKIEPHPDADKLVVCRVAVGEEEPIQIVTGADNIFEGAYVPVVLDGGKVPGPLHGHEKEEGGSRIKAGKLRGVESFGMLCGPQELGWDDKVAPYISKDGIWILSGTYTPGTDLAEALELVTDVVDLDVTPNRPDWLSMLAIAKETKAAYGKEIHLPDTRVAEKAGGGAMTANSIRFAQKKPISIKDFIEVEVEDPKCRRYVARAITDVRIAQSPWWMQHRLMLAGMRPINNIVDIANFVMLEYGQPLHTFDAANIAGKKIIVNASKAGDTITTLDGKERSLPEGTLMINDGERAVGIAGIMGGMNSEISDATRTIILESANFDADTIRLSSKEMTLRTEASNRFARGIDPNICREAADRFCHLVEYLGAGKVVPGAVDIYPEKSLPIPCLVRVSRMNRLNGIEISKDEMKKYLTALDMLVEDTEDDDVMRVTPPTVRLDMKEEIDYAEEIARMYGYDNIPLTLPKMNTQSTVTRSWQIRDIARSVMTSLGANEIQTYSFVSPKSVDMLRLPEDTWEKNFLTLLNPLGVDTSVMRTILMPEMLETMGRNYSRNVERVCAFEIGNTFLPNLADEDGLPSEELAMSIGAYGPEEDFFSLKGRVTALLSMLGIEAPIFTAESEYGAFHPGRCARIAIEDHGGMMELGIMGEVHPEVAEKFGIDTKAYLCELNFEYLIARANIEKVYKPLPKFPAMARDIALIVDEDTTVGKLEEIIQNAGGALVEKAELFDVYRGKQVGEGRKSLAFNILYRDRNKTLTDEDVRKVHERILAELKEKASAVLRDM